MRRFGFHLVLADATTEDIADPDGVVRRAMGGYAPTGSTIGLPMATQNYVSRPIILHRPFRTVGEEP